MINNRKILFYFEMPLIGRKEVAIRKAVYMGGDTDTNACIVGAMAKLHMI